MHLGVALVVGGLSVVPSWCLNGIGGPLVFLALVVSVVSWWCFCGVLVVCLWSSVVSP